MSASITASMLALRDADPAAEADAQAICPDWDSVLARFTAESAAGATDATDVTDVADVEGVADVADVANVANVDDIAGATGEPGDQVARARRRSHRIRIGAAAALVGAAAIGVSVVAWPWSNSGPASVAYGVTKQSDGTVVVRPAPGRPFTASGLQAQLQAAGVRAMVLVESAPGGCAAPPPSTIQTDVITHPSHLPRDVAFVANPAALPAGAVLVVALAPVDPGGASTASEPAFADLFVTRQPPTCIAGSHLIETSPAAPTAASS